MSLVCVALAGGTSSRFGGDKLAADVGGRPVLTRVLDALAEVSDDLYVSVASQPRAGSLARIVPPAVRFILDDGTLGFGGPAAGICTSLMKVGSGSVLFVPADIPWVDAASLKRLVHACAATDSQVGTVFWNDGTTENLVQFYPNGRQAEGLAEVVHARPSVFRATDLLRGIKNTLYVAGRLVAQTPNTFSDVDTSEDLLRPRPKQGEGQRRRSVEVGDKTKRKYTKGVRDHRDGMFEEAARSFILESKDYNEHGLQQIASHCMLDAADSASKGGISLVPLLREAGLRPTAGTSVQRFISPPHP